jgi:hypothetical protein
MKNFSAKSVAFYGLSIGFVAILFSVVTAYGETHLKASMPISGDYSFQLSPRQGCPTENQVNLSIQQSGIYVGASLTNTQMLKASEKKSSKAMTLNGQWKNQQLTLEGVVPSTVFCTKLKKYSQNSLVPIRIQGFFKSSTLSGELLLNSSDQIQITAERQVDTQAKGASH